LRFSEKFIKLFAVTMPQPNPHLALERAVHLLKERGLVDPGQLVEIEFEAICWAEQQESHALDLPPEVDHDLGLDTMDSNVADPTFNYRIQQECLAAAERFVIEAAEKWQFAADHSEGVQREAELSAAIALLINARENLKS
jgi:hypothetical protein